MGRRVVFLDRDGVLVEDVHLLINPNHIHILEGVPSALSRLKCAGFQLIVVSNQAVVARGLMTEEDVQQLNHEISIRLVKNGAPLLDGFYYCPHHPNATLPTYRYSCDCRKPRPGMLLRAAQEHDLDLRSSFLVGDRITDIIAGAKAGCRTILLETGAHRAAAIETPERIDETVNADFSCDSLLKAAEWILDQQ
jgi:D-glycero-D-manno-heptose 1,7-bisphosphate phosphatase